MQSTQVHWAARSLVASVTVLVSGVAFLLFILAPLASWLQGPDGLRTSFAAAIACLLPGLSIVALAHWRALSSKPLLTLLIGTGLRMVPLLIVALVAMLSGDQAVYKYFAAYLVCFYLATLAIETFVSLQVVRSRFASTLEAANPAA